MIKNKLISEIFEEFEAATGRAAKIAVLRKYDHPRLREFFFYAFNSGVEFDVMVPAFRPAVEPAGLNYTYLSQEIPKLYRFIKNHPKRQKLSEEKQKSLLIVLLESLHKDEAIILTHLLKKDLEIKYLTVNLVKEAYPELNI